jgi:hypothetical protein
MKNISKALVLLSLWAGVLTGHAAEAAPDFVYHGYTRENNITLVSLTDRQTQKTSWVALGSTYHGYRLADINPRTGNLILLGAGNVQILRMEKSAGQTSLADAPPPAPVLTREEVLKKLRALKDGEVRQLSEEEANIIRAMVRENKTGAIAPQNQSGIPDNILGSYHPFTRDDLPAELKAKLTDEEIAKRNEDLKAKIAEMVERQKRSAAK